MKGKDRILIQKMINYINDIEGYIENLTIDTFMEDKKTITACAFTVSQIGELAKELTDNTMHKYSNIPWNSIRGMRNRIVHDYENVDLAVLWGTINKSLPQLKNDLKQILFDNQDVI